VRFLRRSNNPNLFVGVILLILLAVFAGPSTLPRFLSTIIPEFYEGVPCAWARIASDRANHQSLLGRAASNPISLRVKSTTLPQDASGSLYITIIVKNDSLGTVPLVFDPQRVIVGDNNTSGVGVIFTPPNSLSTGALPRQDTNTIPDQNLRLLGPRQSCVVTLEFPGGNVLVDPNLVSGITQVRAYYRNNIRGQISQPVQTLATPIYTDEGLWTGYVESPPVPIRPAGQ
jgi:hypothetical protein